MSARASTPFSPPRTLAQSPRHSACLFPPLPATELDAIEARLIKQAGRHFDLRNIKLAVATSREVPFDKLISEDERERFLAGDDLHDIPWRTFELLTQAQKKRYEKFLACNGGYEALRALKTFVSRVIPKPAATGWASGR